MELAELGRGAVSPNPLVGALLTGPEGYRGPGSVLAEGHHARYGGLHAERAALADCAERGHEPAGATVYVSLEPCAHTGRQPPCAEALLEAGVGRVVVAAEDPSAKTCGIGPRRLREAGIPVEFAAPDSEPARRARLQNQPFRKHARTGKPLVIVKLAASLDGRVATPGGDSKWISSPQSRELVHEWRAEADAVGAGIGTVLADDPLLTARPADGCPPHRQPLRVVFDSGARLPLDSQLVATQDRSKLLVVFSAGASSERVEALSGAGVGLFATGLTHDRDPEAAERARRVDLDEALAELGAQGVTSLFCEGGPHLAGGMLDAGEVDELRLFTAPLVLGAGPSLIEGRGHEQVSEALRALRLETERVGPDLLIRAPLREW